MFTQSRGCALKLQGILKRFPLLVQGVGMHISCFQKLDKAFLPAVNEGVLHFGSNHVSRGGLNIFAPSPPGRVSLIGVPQ